MHPSWWSCAVIQFQFLFSSTSNDQKDLKQEMQEQDGGSDPREQLDAPKEASNVAQEQSTTAKTEKSGNQKQLGESTEASKAVFSSPGQLERATHDQKAGVADEVKFQTQMALGLLTFSAGAIISAKSTSFQRLQAGQNLAGAGGQEVNLLGFCFWWSIGLWFINLLSTTFTALATTFREKSPGLLLCAKHINAFNLCVSVVGVAFWIFS